jgi:hypothetical protein
MRTFRIILGIILLLVMAGALCVIETQEIPLQTACCMIAVPFVFFAINLFPFGKKKSPPS